MTTEPASPTLASEPLVRCERLVVGYSGQALLPPIDFAAARGTLTAILGRNGSGKSTFFKTLLGILPPVSGLVRRAPALRAAYVPQTRELDAFLPLRVRDLVGWGLLSGWCFLKPWGRRSQRVAVEEALSSAGALGLADRFVRELSEGQKQRVLFARVLASRADLVLLDEPTAAMDTLAEQETLARLSTLARERSAAVLVITHSLGLAAKLADRAVFLDPDGRAVGSGGRDEVCGHTAFRRQVGEVAHAS